MNHKLRLLGISVLLIIWLILTGIAWFGPAKDISVAERRPLKKRPGITVENVWNGSFMKSFDEYTLDQFPMRDSFRELKSVFHFYALKQSDNNNIYISNGYAAKQEYPLNLNSADFAIKKFQSIYDTYLKNTDSKVYMTLIPDKGYYLAEDSGHLRMDYKKLYSRLEDNTPWANHIDLRDTLSLKDYYHTDTHWRQETLLPAAGKISETLGITIPDNDKFSTEKIEKPFYGVYFGQAALPMKPDYIEIMHSDILNHAKVYDYETKEYTGIYSMEKIQGKDMYDIYLSGAKALLSIENPMATTDRELIVFRDSFGSSMIPLLVQDYARVTAVDIRYINSSRLNDFIEFNGQDVLFLYSTLTMNNSSVLK